MAVRHPKPVYLNEYEIIVFNALIGLAKKYPMEGRSHCRGHPTRWPRRPQFTHPRRCPRHAVSA